MSTDELRQAVAERLGWKFVPNDHGYKCVLYGPDGKLKCCWDNDVKRNQLLKEELPDYPTSLDACREFEKDAPSEYWNLLFESVTEESSDSGFAKISVLWHNVCNATPKQRCRAWLAFVKERK